MLMILRVKIYQKHHVKIPSGKIILQNLCIVLFLISFFRDFFLIVKNKSLLTCLKLKGDYEWKITIL